MVVDSHVRRWYQLHPHRSVRKQLGLHQLGLGRAQAGRILDCPLTLLRQAQKTVSDGVFGAAWLQPRSGELVTDLLERSISWNIPARPIGVGHNNSPDGRGLLFEVLVNHCHHYARYTSQGDIVHPEKAQSDVDGAGVLPLVVLARQRARSQSASIAGLNYDHSDSQQKVARQTLYRRGLSHLTSSGSELNQTQ